MGSGFGLAFGFGFGIGFGFVFVFGLRVGIGFGLKHYVIKKLDRTNLPPSTSKPRSAAERASEYAPCALGRAHGRTTEVLVCAAGRPETSTEADAFAVVARHYFSHLEIGGITIRNLKYLYRFFSRNKKFP